MIQYNVIVPVIKSTFNNNVQFSLIHSSKVLIWLRLDFCGCKGTSLDCILLRSAYENQWAPCFKACSLVHLKNRKFEFSLQQELTLIHPQITHSNMTYDGLLSVWTTETSKSTEMCGN